MGEESPNTTVTIPTGAVFLSYASQDAQAAGKICDALRAAGIEVWFDQSELRGGDVWDQKIRREIHDCALFIPVVSANTTSRHEGYFRLEWDLADQRTHMIARNRVFVVPVCLDTTPESATDVPESFQRVQWTRLSVGEAPSAFVQRVKHLLSAESSALAPQSASAVFGARPATREPVVLSRQSRPTLLAIVAVAVVIVVAFAYAVANKFWVPKHASHEPAGASMASATFSPPPHSIAVLPFVNVSGDKEQEYFSDGLTEELLNSLAEINELQVAARTSSFSFKEHPDIVAVAHKLNVATVLEGSVRRSEHTVRVTAQLINAVTGFHLWSKTYDHDLGDVLKLQTEIATAVASALKVTLLGDEAARIELGGTRNPAAFDAYLRGSKAYTAAHDANDYRNAIASYSDAIRLDPAYALAFAARSIAFSQYAGELATGGAIREAFDKAFNDAHEAIALAPQLAEGALALALVFNRGSLDFKHASDEYERALALAPGSVRVLQEYGRFAVYMGRANAGIAAARRAVVLDPLSPRSYYRLADALLHARRYEEAIAAFDESISVDPDSTYAYGLRGYSYYALGHFQDARSSCEIKPAYWVSQVCLAVTYDKLGRHGDAEAVLAKLRSSMGDSQAFQYAEIYAQWGSPGKAIEWLATAMRLRDTGLVLLKTDPLLDPLRKEPRFQAIERELKFPD